MTALLLAAGSALGNVLGALLLVRQQRKSLDLIHTSIAFGAGFMLAFVVLAVLPEVLREDPAPAALALLLGYLLVHLAQHVLAPHFHFGEETHAITPGSAVNAVIGLALHSLFDGVGIASGFQVSPGLGLLFFLSVVLHKLPEGVTISSVILASGLGPRRALQAGAVTGAATVVGVLLAGALAPLARYGLALAGGVTLYVAASNLVPEVQRRSSPRMSLVMLGGAAFFLLMRAAGRAYLP